YLARAHMTALANVDAFEISLEASANRDGLDRTKIARDRNSFRHARDLSDRYIRRRQRESLGATGSCTSRSAARTSYRCACGRALGRRIRILASGIRAGGYRCEGGETPARENISIKVHF